MSPLSRLSLGERLPSETWVSGASSSDPRSKLMGPRASHFGSYLHHSTGASGNSGGGHSDNFLLDMGATFSAILSNPGPPSSKSTTIRGISGKPITKLFTEPLSCGWDSIPFSHAFLIIPESPTPNLRRDILSNMQASSHMK